MVSRKITRGRNARTAASVGGAMLAWCVTMSVTTSARAQADRVSGTEKGSLLYFTDIELLWRNEPPYELVQDAFVHLTNDYPTSLSVKMFFVNGDPPLDCDETRDAGKDIVAGISFGGGGGGGEHCDRDHLGWNRLDNIIELTMNEPAYWSAATGQPKGVSPWSVLDPGPPPGRIHPNDANLRVLRGFIVAFAVDTISGHEIRWNHLTGDVTLVRYDVGSARQHNAFAFQVVANVAHGDESGTPGELHLDGSEYAPGFSELLMNFVAAGSRAYTAAGGGGDADTIIVEPELTLVPIANDFRQEGDGPLITKVTFDIWNENEVKFTNLDRCLSCWDKTLLRHHAIPNHFLLEALGTDAGKARMDGVQSQLCPGSIDASLLGVASKVMRFPHAGLASSVNLIGMGLESGVVQYDAQGPPPEQNWDPDAIVHQEPPVGVPGQ